MQQNINSSFIKLVAYMVIVTMSASLYIGVNANVFAVSNLGIDVNVPDTTQVGQGDVTYITYQVTNNTSLPVTVSDVKLEYNPWVGIAVESNSGQNLTISPKDSVDFFYTVTVDEKAPEGVKYANFTMEDNGNKICEVQRGKLIVQAKESTGNGHILSDLEVSIEPTIAPKDGWEKEKDNKITFDITNTSEYKLNDVSLELTLPAGFGVSNGTNIKSIGYFDKGRRKAITFPIIVLDNSNVSYLNIELLLKGKDNQGNDFALKKSFYIPNSKANSESPIDDIFIKNIETPKGIESNKNFQMSFDVTNGGKEKLKNLKVTAEMPEGLINKSQNTFVDSFAAGQTRKYSITMSATDPATKSYGIKISATDGEKSGGGNISQYASVYVGGGSGGKVKTPQLMIADYSYGGTYVQTNSPFRLNLKFLNTSGKTISNVKVKLTAAEGTFIPVNASNSFYMDRIGSKETSDHSIMMRAKPDAAQKTTGIDVEMTYEDGSGNEFTTKDVVSIPITQETKIRVDDIISPVDIFPENPVGVSVQFYNMGKSVLNNLRATAYGDFETVDSINYFVGNMEAGKSDTYDFTIVPKKQGVLEGAVVFTYEDGKGVEQSFEKPFTFNVAEALPDMGIMPEEPIEKKVNLKIPAICTGILLILLTAWVLLYRLHKKKLRLGE